MKQSPPLLAGFFVLAVLAPSRAGPPRAETVAELQAAFRSHSGARLVFTAADLPSGTYYDSMPGLDAARRQAAARIALREARKLPAGYLGRVGLKVVGIFSACVSEQGDGYRPYDEELGGYRYFGIWNGSNALAAAYYDDAQLAQTLQHEIFHQVDAGGGGKGAAACFQRDERFEDCLRGKDAYPPLTLTARQAAALRKRCRGVVLENAASKYAGKSVGEDKAETARHLMTYLPDALLQMAMRPDLPGSQRLLHVLHKYEQAAAEGPGRDWFVARALEQAASTR